MSTVKSLDAYLVSTAGVSRDTFLSQQTFPFLLWKSPTDTENEFGTKFGTGSKTGSTQPALLNAPDTLVQALEKTAQNMFLDRIFVGRANNNDIIIRHTSISKAHAFFALANGVWTITDIESRNGTKVRDVAVLANESQALTGDNVPLTLGKIAALFVTPAGFFDLLRGLAAKT